MKKTTKIISLVMAFALFAAVFAGCGSSDKEFSSNGFSITLPGNAKEMSESLGYTAAYQVGGDIVVAAIEESKSSLASLGLAEDAVVLDYAVLVAEVNGYSGDDVTTISGTEIPYFEYTSTVSGVEYSYMGACFKADDAFWFVNFGTTKEKYDSVKADFEKWAKSVKV